MNKPVKKCYFKRDFTRVKDYEKAKLREEGFNQAISDYEAYENSIEGLPERKEAYKDQTPYNCIECGDEGWVEGFNQMRDIAIVLLGKQQKKIEELEIRLEKMKEFINNHPDGKELQAIKETYKNIVSEKCGEDEEHCTCVPALRERIEELENKYWEMTCNAEGERLAKEKLQANKPSVEEIFDIIDKETENEDWDVEELAIAIHDWKRGNNGHK